MDKRKYDKLNTIKLIGSGIEGNVYLYNDHLGRKTALKIFKRQYDFDFSSVVVPEKTFINKEKKLQFLSKQSCLKGDIKLLDLIYDNEKFIGYTSLYEPYKSFEDVTKKKERLKLLKKLKDRVIELNNEGILIGDYNSSNFGIEEEKIKLYDIDNFKTEDYDFDLATSYINYFRRNSQKREYLDNYCFNIFSISFYENIVHSYVLQYLENEGLPKKMNTDNNKELKLQLLYPRNDYKPDFLIDNMKKGFFN